MKPLHTLQRFAARLHPVALLALGFAALILIGMVFLSLPVSRAGTDPLPTIDALFTSTSAVCVTGLIVVDTGSFFSLFGQIVLLILIQIGGIGVMTLSVLIFRVIGKRISYRQRLIMQDVFTQAPRADIFRLVRSIAVFTLITEGLGAILLFGFWVGEFPWPHALVLAVFHSVSAFCNAGFSLFSTSMITYASNAYLNGVILTLIILGGLGFPVIYELQQRLVSKKIRKQRLSVHSRTVLITTVILILLGTLVFFTSEQFGALKGKPLEEKVLISVFQSVTCRTAGFNSIDTTKLHEATLTFMLFLMFIGASPGSCGGGIKTTTLALLLATAWSKFRGRSRAALFRRSLPSATVIRGQALALLALAVVMASVFLLQFESHFERVSPEGRDPFLSYLFETVSAFGTVGLSMGASNKLTSFGKILISILMFIGRVGVLSFAYMLTPTGRTVDIEYAEEDMMIG
ncbi:MAG TPA: TrkH family potassium uptake protein [Thermoanaerobaculia bacterium]|nr:TrkH family potassium uptake protein [Thermoanaerobaculia bacterium]HUM30261.1 TrkH family potassium uptake protein [Thermoanaerobaculia bacterium]HXK68443.1 TrkH family potassium uptake protein [Thermoanaerobaculia bacterium]